MAGKSVTLGQAIFELTLDTKKFRIQSLLAQKSFRKIGNAANTLGKTLATGLVAGVAVATAAMVKLGVESAKTGAEFEQSIKTVSAIMGATDGSEKSVAAMQSLTNEARRLGSQTAYTATQAGDAMQNLARAGLNANQIIGASGPALMLAGASASTMSAATDLMASSMKQFGLNADQATRMTDAFTIVQQKTLMDMEHLTSAMRYGGTIAAGMGMGIEETSAALGLFRDLGVEGSTAGTQFRQAMIQLAAPTRKAEKTLKKYGLTLDDVNPEVKTFSHVMKTLGAAGMTMGDMAAVVGKRAAGSVQKISEEFANGTTKYHELTEAMFNGAGTTEKTYNAMMDTVKGRFTIMKSAFQEFQLTMFDSFKAPLKELIGTDDNSGVTGIINSMSEAMNLAGSEMANGPFQQGMREMTEYFNENQAEIAAKVIVTIQEVIEAGKKIVEMLPALYEAGKAMLVLWAVSTVTTWVTTLGQAVMALWRFVSATRAAQAAAVAFQGSLGWVGAISLAIGAMAAALFQTGDEAAKASAKATILAEQLKAATEAKKEFKDASVKSDDISDDDLAGMKTGYSQLRVAASEQLGSKGLKNEKEVVRLSKAYEALGEEQRKTALANGEMITIMVKGEKVAVKYKDALKFEGMKEQADFHESMSKSQRQVSKDLRIAKKDLKETRKSVNKVDHAYQQYLKTQNKFTKFGLVSVLHQEGWISSNEETAYSVDDLTKAVSRAFGKQQKYTTLVGENTKKLAALKNQTVEYNNAINEASAAEDAADKKKEGEAKKKKPRGRGSGTDWKARRAAAEEATRARIDMEQELQRTLSNIEQEGALDRVIEVQDAMKNMRRVYDEEIEAIKRTNRRKTIGAQQKLAIEKSYIDSVLALYAKLDLEIRQDSKERTEALRKELKAEYSTRADIIKEGVKEDIKEREKEYQQEIEGAQAAAAQVVEQREEVLTDMGKTKAGRIALKEEIEFETEMIFVDKDGKLLSPDTIEKALTDTAGVQGEGKHVGTMAALQIMDEDLGDDNSRLAETSSKIKGGEVKPISGQDLVDLKASQQEHVSLWMSYNAELDSIKAEARSQAVTQQKEEEAELKKQKKLLSRRKITLAQFNDAIKDFELVQEASAKPLDFKGTDKQWKAHLQNVRAELIETELLAEESNVALLKELTPSDEDIKRINAPFKEITTAEQYQKAFMRAGTLQDEFLNHAISQRFEHKDNVKRIEESKNTDLELITQIGNTKIAKLQDQFLQRMEDERLSMGLQSPIKILEAQQAAAIKRMKTEGATDETIEAQKRHHVAKMAELQESLLVELVRPYGQYTEEIDRLENKAVNSFNEKTKEKAKRQAAYLKQRAALEKKMEEVAAKSAGLSAGERIKAMKRVQDEMDRLDATNAEVANNGVKSWSFWKEGLVKAGKVILQTLSMVGTAVIAIGKELFEAVTKSFSFITGGKLPTSISGFLQAGTSAAIKETQKAQEELKKLEEQLSKGEITQEQFDEQKKAGVGAEVDAGEAGAKAVESKFDDAMNFAKTLASGAPAILQKVAEQIPILVDSLVESIPKLIDALAQNLPPVVVSLIDGIIELLPRVVDSLVTALPLLVDGIVLILTEKLPQLLATLGPLVQNLVDIIVSQAPRIVAALVAALPNVVTFLVNAIETLLTGIPQLLSSILAAVPTIVTELLGGIGDIIAALLQAIPEILDALIGQLPTILQALIVGLLGVIQKIAAEVPVLVGKVIKMIPVLLDGLLKMLPDLILALVDAIPAIIIALADALPELISSLITLIPDLIAAIIKALPDLLVALVKGIFELIFVQLPLMLAAIVTGIVDGIIDGVSGIGELLTSAWDGMMSFFDNLPEKIGNAFLGIFDSIAGFFSDVIDEIVTLGSAETATFGDTPEAIRAGANGMMARFAPNDLIVAAQDPLELLRQSIDAVGGRLGRVGTSGMGMDPNALSAIMASVGGGAQSAPMDLTIMAEGRVLDEVQIKAMDRGHAPRMKQKFKKASGVNVGFSRGRYNRFSGTR